MKKSKDLELLRKSIKHWCLDIRRPLLKGGRISEIFGSFYWRGRYNDVKMLSADCALCMEYGPTCNYCPLNIIGEKCCSKNSVYGKFYCNLNIDSANNMISVLVKAYRVAVSDGNER